MPARLRLSWGMKTLRLFLLSVLESLEFGWQAIRYALILVSAFFRQRASLGCEMVAMRSQLTFFKESIRQKSQPRPRFHRPIAAPGKIHSWKGMEAPYGESCWIT